MLIDADGVFFTQRTFPKMATISVGLNGNGMNASANGFEPLNFPLEPGTGKRQEVTIWDSICEAENYDDSVNRWFSDVLETNCRLVLMPETTDRRVDPQYAVRKDVDVVSFADGYPFLLIGERALADLNSRLDEPVPMNRFRPNIVASGADAFAEDDWKKIRIGETVFHVVKPCARCVVTTVDQSTGEKTEKEPLKTLSTYRNRDGKVLFGQNLIAEKGGGVIRVGDEIEILATG